MSARMIVVADDLARAAAQTADRLAPVALRPWGPQPFPLEAFLDANRGTLPDDVTVVGADQVEGSPDNRHEDAVLVVLPVHDIETLLVAGWLNALSRGRLVTLGEWVEQRASRAAKDGAGSAESGDRSAPPAAHAFWRHDAIVRSWQQRVGDRLVVVAGAEPAETTAQIETALGLAPGTLRTPAVSRGPGLPEQPRPTWAVPADRTAALMPQVVRELLEIDDLDREEAGPVLADTWAATAPSAFFAVPLSTYADDWVTSMAADLESSGVSVVGDLSRLRLASPTNAARAAGELDFETAVALGLEMLAVLEEDDATGARREAALVEQRERVSAAKTGQTKTGQTKTGKAKAHAQPGTQPDAKPDSGLRSRLRSLLGRRGGPDDPRGEGS